MTKEEIKEYIVKNLQITVTTDPTAFGEYLTLSIKLEGEEIDMDGVLLPRK